MEGDELGPVLPFNLHPALIQEDDSVSPNSGPVARSAPIEKFHLSFAEIKLRIMSQTEEKGVTGSHNLTISLCIYASVVSVSCARAFLLVGLQRASISDSWSTSEAPLFRAWVGSTSLLSHSPGSVLQVRMRQLSLIAAHLAAHIYSYAILGPGLCDIAASRTVVQETSRCHDQFSSLGWIYFA